LTDASLTVILGPTGRKGVDVSYAPNQDDWDRYEGLQWQAAERYAADHPDDPDVEPLLQTSRGQRDAYLRWGRECLGWAMYLFRKPRGSRP